MFCPFLPHSDSKITFWNFISLNNAGEYTDNFKAVIHIRLTSSLEATKNCWPCQLPSDTRSYITIFYKNIETCTDTKPKEVVTSHFLKLQQREWIFSLQIPHCLFPPLFFYIYIFFVSFQFRATGLSFTIDFLWW